jgi:hypothetical protein
MSNDGDNMKDLFPGHFNESEEKLQQLWGSCIFVFDANIILNFYRYSDATRDEFFEFLKKIKNRIWLPHRAAEEYLNNRLSVIYQQECSYDDTVKSINSLKSDLDNARQHPFVSQEAFNEAKKVFKLLCKELSENKQVHTARISNDEIQESISLIFENKVGQPYSEEKLKKMITDGEERYKQKIPPGFKDEAKSGDSEVFTEICRKYGDLIVWNQIIDNSIATKKGVVLVTDDKKEDWWEKFKGKTIGPRPELVKEFKDKTGNNFHMYQADRFLEFARKFLNEQISNEIVKEIREVRRRDKLDHRKRREGNLTIQRNISMRNLVNRAEMAQGNIEALKIECKMLLEEKRILEMELENSREQINQSILEDTRGIDSKQQTDYYQSQNQKYYQTLERIDQHSLLITERERQIRDLKQELDFLEQERYFANERSHHMKDEIDHRIIISERNKESDL